MALTMLAAILVGCSHSDSVSMGSTAAPERTQTEGVASETTETKEEGAEAAFYKFAFLPSTQNSTFQAAVNDTSGKLCDERGYNYVCLDPDYDLNIRLSQMIDVTIQNFNAVFVIPVDLAGTRQDLEQIHKKNIPILSVDTPAIDDGLNLVETVIATGAYNAGALIGQQMTAGCPDGAKIVMLGFPSNGLCVNRVIGFLDGLGDTKDEFDIAVQQDGTIALDISMPIAEDIIQIDPGLNAFLCINDPSALDTVAIVKASGETGIGVYSIDAPPDGKTAIFDDSFMAVAAQIPIGIAETTSEKAGELLTGDEIEKETLLPSFLIDKEKAEAMPKDWQ